MYDALHEGFVPRCVVLLMVELIYLTLRASTCIGKPMSSRTAFQTFGPPGRRTSW